MAGINLCSEPVEINLCIIPGATYRHTVQYMVGETEADAVGVDLSQATAEMHVRDEADNLLLDLNTTNGGITMDADGNITFFVAKEDSSAFDWEEGSYESLEITYVNGDVEAFSKGTVGIGTERTK